VITGGGLRPIDVKDLSYGKRRQVEAYLEKCPDAKVGLGMMIYSCPVCGEIRNTVGGEVGDMKINYCCKKCDADMEEIEVDEVTGSDCPRCAHGMIYAGAEMLWD